MPANQPNTIYPCPFSKGYGIPVEQAWSLLKVFLYYRLLVSSIFALLFFSPYSSFLLQINNPQLYNSISQSYCLFIVLSGIFVMWRLINYTSQAQIAIFTDIIFITLLMHASGSINSGIGILLVVTTAAGGLLIGGRCALLFAALASLSVLAEQVYIFRYISTSQASLTYAGMLGASFFTIAYLSYVLAKRTELSEILASEHKVTISKLEDLNQYIIQHMQSGIIISNSAQKIRMSNEAALTILCQQNIGNPHNISHVSKQLSKSFQIWLADNSLDFSLIRLPNHVEIHARFSFLKTNQETLHMIILEDATLYNQRLQQSKLASLGRLTASIAHEIRNPLGAISHAGQLLSEAPSLSSEDQRLTEIIQSHSLRVNKIIEDILQLSRRAPSRREKINLNQWIKGYLAIFLQSTNYSASDFKIIIKKMNLWIYMDQGHLKQILDNLCINALKYGDISTYSIIIETDIIEGAPTIRILDHGSEIDKETVKHLFEPFYTTSSTGTGLGLYISKELAELNQATLNYAVTKDYKCSFKLSLPDANNTLIEI